jgi:cbb3-type cytochrome oxidase cytochrome c subunit
VVPYSVMPGYPWMFDENRRPTDRALAVVAYLQWLGSWVMDGVIMEPGGPSTAALAGRDGDG